MERFLVCFYRKIVCRDVEDRVFWTETKSDKFIVKSLYDALELGSYVSFPTSSIWNLWVQPKVIFFT